jgi:hypothetical protein
MAELEAAVNEASQRDLVDPEALREALDSIPPRPGAPRLRRLLDRDTFVLTTTRLEQLFLPLARAAGQAGGGQPPRPSAYCRRSHVTPLHPLAGAA